MFELNTPVVFCTFNRIEPTVKVFEQIRKAKPKVLYLVSDAPRKDRADEKDKVIAVRDYLESHIDWICDVKKIYAVENMGCAKRISSALDEVFSIEDSAIILEDDCLPVNSFFEFCQTMLEWYKDDCRIMSIAGCPEIEYKPKENVDYFFTNIYFCCGWATWKRSWDLYDFDLSNYGKHDYKKLKESLISKKAFCNYTAQFSALKNLEKKFSWAYQFSYASMVNQKMNIVPSKNQICNLGFCEDSTHTSEKPFYFTTRFECLEFPLTKNTRVERDIKFEKLYYRLTQKAGYIVKFKQLLGLDINKSFFSRGK